MIPAQTNAKQTLPIFQSSTTNGGTASGNIDTLGFDYLTLNVLLPTADSTSNKPTVLKLGESDDTVVTNFADVVGFRGGTDFTIPNAQTAATNVTQPFAMFNVDLRGRKRYLKISVTPQTTQVVNAIASLTRGEQTPSTSAQASVVVTGPI